MVHSTNKTESILNISMIQIKYSSESSKKKKINIFNSINVLKGEGDVLN